MKDFQFYIFVRSFSQPSLAPGLVSTYIEEQSCAVQRSSMPGRGTFSFIRSPPQIIKFSGHSLNSKGKKSMAWPLLLCAYLGGSESRLSFFINRARVNRWTLILQSKKYIYLII